VIVCAMEVAGACASLCRAGNFAWCPTSKQCTGKAWPGGTWPLGHAGNTRHRACFFHIL